MNHQQFVQMARALSPDDWLELLIDPKNGPLGFAEHLPKLPPDDIQIATAGKSGLGTMREAFDFYNKVKGIYIQCRLDKQ